MPKGESVPTEHPTLQTLAALLTGDVDVETLRGQIVPHLVEVCPTCADHLETIRDLVRQYDHWNESIVVQEASESAALLRDLLDDDDHERCLTRVDEDDELHTWAVAQDLMRASHDLLFENPMRAVEVAELALHVSDRLPGSAYHEEWLMDLRARALGYLGNARRVVGELRSAEADLRQAIRWARRRGTCRPIVEAELRDFLTSLRLAQRRFDEALAELDQAASLYREEGDEHRVGRTQIKRAKIFEERGEIEAAIALLHEVPRHLDADREPRLLFFARANLLCCLTLAGRYEEALEMLAEVRPAHEDQVRDVDRIRLRWLEGRIADGLGNRREAEAHFTGVQRFFLEKNLDLEAAQVSIELAVLYAADGRRAELRELVAALVPLFESRDLRREVLAVLHLLRRAVERDALSHQVALELAAVVQRRSV
jgi:tetratricopeptide (TPR) repeat protein